MTLEEAANIGSVGAFVLGIAGAAVTVWRFTRSGYRLAIEIIPPRQNRNNRKPTDRGITITVSNHGNEPALVAKLRLRTVKSNFVGQKKITKEAVFDDSTPWKPAHTLAPGSAKTYDLNFFDNWTKAGNPAEKIEVAVFLRGTRKPFVHSIWP